MSLVFVYNKASRSWLNSMRQVINWAFPPCQSFVIMEHKEQDRAAQYILQRNRTTETSRAVCNPTLW